MYIYRPIPFCYTCLYYVKKYVCAIENEDTIYCFKPAIYLSLIAIFLDAIILSINKLNYFSNSIESNSNLILLYSCLCGTKQVHNMDCLHLLCILKY